MPLHSRPSLSQIDVRQLTVPGELVATPPSGRALLDSSYAEHRVPGDCVAPVAYDAIAMVQEVGEQTDALRDFKNKVQNELAADRIALEGRRVHTETALLARDELLTQVNTMFTRCLMGADTDTVWLGRLERKGKVLEGQICELDMRLQGLSAKKNTATQAVTDAFSLEEAAFQQLTAFKAATSNRVFTARHDAAVQRQQADFDAMQIVVGESEIATYLNEEEVKRLEDITQEIGQLIAKDGNEQDLAKLSPLREAITCLHTRAANNKRQMIKSQLPSPDFSRGEVTRAELTNEENEVLAALEETVHSFGATLVACVQRGDAINTLIQEAEKERDIALRELNYVQSRHATIRNTSIPKRNHVIQTLEMTFNELIGEITELNNVDMIQHDIPLATALHSEVLAKTATQLEELEQQLSEDVMAELERDGSLKPTVEELILRREAIMSFCEGINLNPVSGVAPQKIQYRTTLLSPAPDGALQPVEVTRTVHLEPMVLDVLHRQENIRELRNVLTSMRANVAAAFQQRAEMIARQDSYYERIIDGRIAELVSKPESGSAGGLIYTLPELAKRANSLELCARELDEEAGIASEELAKLLDQRDWDAYARRLHIAEIVRLARIVETVERQREIIIDGHKRYLEERKSSLATASARPASFATADDVEEAQRLLNDCGYEQYGVPSGVEAPVREDRPYFDPKVNDLTAILKETSQQNIWAEKRREVTTDSITYLDGSITSTRQKLAALAARVAKLRGSDMDEERNALLALEGILTASKGALMSLQSSYAEWDAHIPASVTEQADRLTEDPEGAEVFTPMAPEPKLTLPQDTKMPGRHRKPTKAKAKLRPAVFFKIFAASLVGSEPEVTFAKHNQ